MRDNIEESMYIGGRNSVREALAADQVKEIFCGRRGQTTPEAERGGRGERDSGQHCGYPPDGKVYSSSGEPGSDGAYQAYQYQVLDEILLASKGKIPF